MRHALASAVVCLLCLAGGAQAETLSGTVVAVHDGDTISIRTPASTVRVRLVGIDCPEGGQPYSARARRYTSSLVFKKAVTVESRGVDRYDRVLGRVLVDGVDVNEAIVRNGLAWQYPNGPQDPRITAAEKAARAGRVGLWADPDPIPPWRWRRGPSQRPAPRSAVGDAAEVRGPFRGNVRSRVFHRPGCRNYDCRNCVEVFATAAAAIQAGFRPSGDCMR